MSGAEGEAAHSIADLVTQAPDEAPAEHVAPHHGGTVPAGGFSLAKLCACLFGAKPTSAAPKLASVVPCEANKATASTPAQRAVAAAAAAAEPASAVARGARPSTSDSGTASSANPWECGWGPNRDEPPQLGPQTGDNIGRKTLVLDLDETLVHSSFRATTQADIIITVELEGEHHKVFVRKRPGVDEFLVKVAKMYEVVVYTASMAKYANPLLDELDKCRTVAFRLFREACTRHANGYVKDLSRLGRDLRHVIILDNSPLCYALQPENAIPIRTWRDDMSDRALWDLVPILHSLAEVEDIPVVLRQVVWSDEEEDRLHPSQAGAEDSRA